MENTEKNIYADVAHRFPEHLQETMSKLPLETQQRLYLDIFKPLDFYELLFEYFKEKPRKTPATVKKNVECCYKKEH